MTLSTAGTRSPALADESTTATAVLVGLAAIAFTTMYFVSDLVEVAQGDFSPFRLTLTYLSEAALPLIVVGLYGVQRPRIGRLGFVGALAFAYSYVFFTGTVMYALAAGVVLVAAASGLPTIARTAAAAVPDAAFIGMGFALLRPTPRHGHLPP